MEGGGWMEAVGVGGDGGGGVGLGDDGGGGVVAETVGVEVMEEVVGFDGAVVKVTRPLASASL